MRLGIVVLNWNGYADTRECLRSLFPLPDGLRVYVVDNASTDGSAERLMAEFGDKVTWILNEKNLLFAGGNNRGVEAAFHDGCEAVLLLNNDTIVNEETVPRLVEAAQRYPKSLLSPKILYAYSREQIWYAGGTWNPETARAAHRGIGETDAGQYDREELTEIATGCAMVIPREIWTAVGKLDESFRLYFEDVDYSLRVVGRGYGVYYCPASRVWHKVSVSLGGNFSWRKQFRKLRGLWRLLDKRGYSWKSKAAAIGNYVVLEPLRFIVRKIRQR